MNPEVKTVGQVVAEIARLMPKAVSCEMLAEYGLDASPEQAQRVTLEVLHLNLFWIFAACDDLLTRNEAARLQDELCRRLMSVWTSEHHLDQAHQELFARELDARHRDYAAVLRQGGHPGAVCVEGAELMERSKLILPEDRMKMVALLVDLTPVDAYAEALRGIQLIEG